MTESRSSRSPKDSNSPLSWSLREFVWRYDPSVRLHNVAKQSELFEVTSVGELLTDWDNVSQKLLALPNFGRKSLAELKEALKNLDTVGVVSEMPSIQLAQDDPHTTSQNPATALPDEFRRLSLRDVVVRVGASVRLTSASNSSSWFNETSLESYVSGHTTPMPRVRNFGRTSRTELDGLVRDFVAVAIEICEKSGSTGELGDIDAVIRTAFKATAARRFARAEVDKMESSEDAALSAVAALGKSERFVIERRYGLAAFSPMTLEEIGVDARVSRERVRQVERKAIARLHQAAVVFFERYLEHQSATMVQALSEGYQRPSLAIVTRNRKKLTPLQSLAIDVAHGGFAEWLSAVGAVADNRWRPHDGFVAVSDAQRDAMTAYVRQVALPRPLTDLAVGSGIPMDSCSTLIEAIPGLSCALGFVFSGFVGAKARRVARLYDVARELPGIFDIQTLIAKYRKANPSDDVASRIILLALEENPHLFARLFDALWVVLPLRLELDITASSLPFERRRMNDDGGFETGTIGSCLVSQLRAAGASRLNDLADLVEQSHGTRASATPILISNPCFQRIAPGVFDLYSGVDARADALLNSQQCRNYAYARFGGAPAGYFPAWDYDYERRLAEWSRFNAPTDVFRSLLMVLAPDQWQDADEGYWKRLVTTHGAWSLRTNREKRLSAPLPKPEALFGGLLHLRILGDIGWCGANRVSQQRFDGESGAELVAFLVAIGAASAASEWQASHAATSFAEVCLQRLADERWRAGGLEWSSGYLAELLTRARQSDAPRPEWVSAEELADYLNLDSDMESPSGEAQPDTSGDIDELLESTDFSRLFDS